MKVNEKSHTSTVISSLNKIYDQSKIYGELHPKSIYILDAIYKLLSGCETSITNCQRKSLYSLYTKLLYNSKYICPAKPYKPYIMTGSNFIQAETTDCNTLPPIQDLVYYWQEDLGVTASTIINNIANSNYLETKPVTLKTNFIEGKDINYTNIGLICFALNKSTVSTSYIIYDDNDADVTDGFQSFYNADLETRIFISYNIYSHGIMNFKIKKI